MNKADLDELAVELRRDREQLLVALRAACAISEGHAYFRTANGIFMEMPRKTERLVKAALRPDRGIIP
jgi:hypothetical protein